ncbi:unnamed protein product [Laminaria digitata]
MHVLCLGERASLRCAQAQARFVRPNALRVSRSFRHMICMMCMMYDLYDLYTVCALYVLYASRVIFFLAFALVVGSEPLVFGYLTSPFWVFSLLVVGRRT